MTAPAPAAGMTRSEFLSSVDRAPNLAYSVGHLTAAWGQLALMIGLLSVLPEGWPWKLAAVLGMGWTQYRIYFPLHEAAHQTLFRSAAANRIAGRLCAALLFSSFENFTRIHMEHHRSWGSADDPGSMDYLVHFRSRWHQVAFFGSPLLGGQLLVKLWENLGEPLLAAASGRGAERTRRVGAGGRIPPVDLAWLAGVQGGLFVAISGLGARPLDYVWGYLLPGATVFLFLARLRMYLEHGPVDYAVSDYAGDNARRIARTHRSNLLERPLFSYMNFRLHYEHHLFPSLPSVRLPEVYRRFTSRRLHPDDFSRSYLHTLRRIARLP